MKFIITHRIIRSSSFIITLSIVLQKNRILKLGTGSRSENISVCIRIIGVNKSLEGRVRKVGKEGRERKVGKGR